MTSFRCSKETERLIVRPLEKEDYAVWLSGFNERMPSQYRHDKGKLNMEECTEGWFAELVEKHQRMAQEDTAYIFGVFQCKDGSHLGMIDFSTYERADFQWGRIGYSIHNQFWGQGFGSEAVMGALEIAFQQLKYHRIEAHINLDNEASIKLAERAGMKYECVRKGFIFEFGEWTDNLVYYINAPQ
ncbi:GNAT family N-acetyltransferase [Bacillus sp. AK031]